MTDTTVAPTTHDRARPQPLPTAELTIAAAAAIAAAPLGTAEAADTDEDAGLGRSLVLGGIAGFLVVYAIAFALLEMFGGYGIEVAAGASVFVGLFGGIGFGSMVAASIR
jgi:hypothetical protein